MPAEDSRGVRPPRKPLDTQSLEAVNFSINRELFRSPSTYHNLPGPNSLLQSSRPCFWDENNSELNRIKSSVC